MKPLTISKIFKGILYKILTIANLGLHHIELLNSKHETNIPYPPIFIIGAPRSGSTLLYQVLTDYYDVGYLSNFHAKFYGAPSLVERLFHPLKWRQASDYTSDHGRTEGWLAPSECGEFWYRFFRRKPQDVSLTDADEESIFQLRNAVNLLINTFNKPFLFKNMNCALRLQPTAKALPEALFIVIHRDLLDNAHSLLEVRKKMYDDYATWWSMEPAAIEQLKTLLPHEQVIEQIRHIYTLIETDREVIGVDRFINVQYEEFCNDSHDTLNKLDNFFQKHGLQITKRRQLSEIPDSFQQRDQIRIDPKLYSELVNYASSQ